MKNVMYKVIFALLLLCSSNIYAQKNLKVNVDELYTQYLEDYRYEDKSKMGKVRKEIVYSESHIEFVFEKGKSDFIKIDIVCPGNYRRDFFIETKLVETQDIKGTTFYIYDAENYRLFIKIPLNKLKKVDDDDERLDVIYLFDYTARKYFYFFIKTK